MWEENPVLVAILPLERFLGRAAAFQAFVFRGLLDVIADRPSVFLAGNQGLQPTVSRGVRREGVQVDADRTDFVPQLADPTLLPRDVVDSPPVQRGDRGDAIGRRSCRWCVSGRAAGGQRKGKGEDGAKPDVVMHGELSRRERLPGNMRFLSPGWWICAPRPLPETRFPPTFLLPMNFVFWFLILLHVVGCFGLILLVLVQNDKAGGLSSAFGGMGSSQAFSSAGAATFVSKLTKWWAVALFVVIFSINLLVSRAHVGREGGSAVQKALQEDGAAKVLREMGAPEGPQAPVGLPGMPVSVPGVPQAPAAP